MIQSEPDQHDQVEYVYDVASSYWTMVEVVCNVVQIYERQVAIDEDWEPAKFGKMYK